jgi:hypothetical protein
MRPITIAAGILTLALGTIPATKSAARAATNPVQQAGPMRSPSAANESPRAVQGQQEQQSPPQEQRPLQVQVSIVNVFATVRDKHHAIVNNLTKDDFKISEDGQDQKVAFFSKEVDMPITLGMLMDTSYSMYHILDAEKSAAARFLKEVMRKRDEAMVIGFDTDVNLLADFTEDTSVLDQAIDRATINVDASGIGGTPGTIASSNGGTDLYDAIYLACHDQMASEAGRKALILLTDAEDTGSKMSEQDAIEAAQRADAGGGVANRMAEQTGGRVIDVRNEDSLEKAFDQISEELRSQYVLGYYPTNTKRDGTFRKIQVKVDQPDVKVLARRGYYAPRH